jgi:hypothetical protein
VRELLEAELRWRNLPRFRELHFQVRDHIIQQIQQRSGLAQQFAVFALLFLHRNNPFMRPFYEWQSLGQLYIDVAQPADLPIINQLFRQHQGEESLAAARYWQTRPQATFFVFRAAGRGVAGFCQVLDISQATAEDMAADPAVATAVHTTCKLPPPSAPATSSSTFATG